MTYTEAVAWLYGLQLHGIKLGLDSMLRLCAELGLDLEGGRGPVFLHVAGTNGKGSVCAMLATICREASLRTGLYTSPHLVTFRERMQIDGAMIPKAGVAAGLTRIRDIVVRWDCPPTFFEVATALALDWFRSQRAEIVVLETGLGGRLDATNVVTPAVSIITPIGLDHQRFLGETLAEIAGEKCGIIKLGMPVVSAPQEPEPAAVIGECAAKAGSTLTVVSKPLPAGESVGLVGHHQRWNAAVAIATLAVSALRPPFDRIQPEHIRRGLEAVRWPGRFQRVRDRYVLDGAHNPAAAATLVETWKAEFPGRRATLILGVMRDKDVAAVCATLAPIAARIFTVTVGNSRSCSAEELAAIMRAQAPDRPCIPMAQLESALPAAAAAEDPILIGGSLFLVAEALCALGISKGEPEQSSQ